MHNRVKRECPQIKELKRQKRKHRVRIDREMGYKTGARREPHYGQDTNEEKKNRKTRVTEVVCLCREGEVETQERRGEERCV